MAEPPRVAAWRRHPRILGLGGLAAAALAAGLVVWATGASGTGGFRVAVAGPATVRQTLDLSGTADPVKPAKHAAFQVGGTVATVDVTLGQTVTAGQALASLDTTTLTQNVSSVESTMTADEAKLTEDETAQTTSSTSAASSPSSSSGGSSGLAAAQQKVVGAQQVADADEQSAAAALTQAQTACGGAGGSGGGGSGGSGGGGPGGGTTTTTTTSTTTTTTTTTTMPSTTTTTTPSGTDTSSCTAALTAALSAQKQVATDQKGVSTAESALAQVLSSSTSSTSNPSSTGSDGSSGSGGGGSGLQGSGASGTDTPAQLASDQAAIDSAYASLFEAQQSLADAQLVSPIAGTVASVGLAPGQSVQAGSSTDAIEIINGGTFEVVGSLTGAQSSEVKDGDNAVVTVDGTTGTDRGTVVRVGPVDTSGSSDTYPVVVALSPGSHGIAAGSSAQLSLVLRQVDDTLAVPTSAVNTLGPRGSYVLVLRGGTEVRQRVTVGVVGSVYTQITGGISDGTSVVLADLSEAIPTSSTTTGRFGTFGAGGLGGGLGGAGFGGGGLGGGGFARVQVNAAG